MASMYTTFPDSVQTFEIKTDVSSSVYSAWKQFNTYIANGEFANATTLLQSNTELRKCIIDSGYINSLSKTIEELQDLFLNDIQSYIHETVIHKGLWNAVTKYNKYNFVTYSINGVMQTFECLRDDTPIGVAPTNTTYWVIRTIRGEDGEQGASGAGLSPRGTWSIYEQYYQDDLVSYNNVLWAAKEDNIGLVPNDNSTIWYSVLSLNIVLSELKIQNSEIDAIMNGTAIETDDETGVGEESYQSISPEEIDNVLNS